MPDFKSVDRSGIATLVNPQYVVSVKHNVGYQSVVSEVPEIILMPITTIIS